MNNRIKFYIYFFILICFLVFPITVHAEGEEDESQHFGVSDPWEVDVTMKVDESSGLYKSSFSTNGMSSTDKVSAWNHVFTEYKGIIVGISGVCTLTFILLFILNFIKLGQSAGNPQLRSQALTALLWTGIAAAGCGGFTLFVGFSTNLFRKSFY